MLYIIVNKKYITVKKSNDMKNSHLILYTIILHYNDSVLFVTIRLVEIYFIQK